MAKRNSTVKKAPRVKRESAADRADRIYTALSGARAAVSVTRLVLLDKGVMDDVAFNLTRGALLPLEALMAEFVEVSNGR
jgi:hypothetical protein